MRIEATPTAILRLGTAVPDYPLNQDEVAQRLTEALGPDTDTARWVDRLFKRSGVESRYTCVPHLLKPASRRFLPNWPLKDVPTTAERMEIYKRESIRLGVSAAKKALAFNDSHENSVEQVASITHLIVVSCTGFFIPGLDIALIKQLHLPLNINRICLTFMGCAAGMTALRLASQIAKGNTAARILVVSVELCTLHVQPTRHREGLFATALFGDGAAACVVGSSTVEQRGIFEFDGDGHTSIIPDTPDAMTWDVGNYGFELYLSPKLPDHLAQFAPSEIRRYLGTGSKPEFWAIHPGGRGIVDVLQRLLDLTNEQTEASRSILRRYGNLSSATIFFVLDEMRRQLVRDAKSDQKRHGIAMAFGPGLSIEMLRLTWLPTGEV